MRPKTVQGRESSVDLLRRLKSQESSPIAKPFVTMPEIKTPTTVIEDKRIVVKEIEPVIINAEKILRRMEEVEKKAKFGENYLGYYADIKFLEEQFIRATDSIEKSNDTAAQRLLMRRDMILKRRAMQL